jgi:hypothetical protein
MFALESCPCTPLCAGLTRAFVLCAGAPAATVLRPLLQEKNKLKVYQPDPNADSDPKVCPPQLRAECVHSILMFWLICNVTQTLRRARHN